MVHLYNFYVLYTDELDNIMMFGLHDYNQIDTFKLLNFYIHQLFLNFW